MRKFFCILFLLTIAVNVFSDDIKFPPELLWWIYEVKKANSNIEINGFTQDGKETIKLNNYYRDRVLTYPVFKRWNYSGNTVAYYDYYRTQPRKLASGKYSIGDDFDDVSTLLLADKNGKVFYGEDFGLSEGLNAICWLTDTVLIGVGISINLEDYDADLIKVDLIIIEYTVNNKNKSIEKKYYVYKNAIKNEDRLPLKLNWYEQRTDYFEIR